MNECLLVKWIWEIMEDQIAPGTVSGNKIYA